MSIHEKERKENRDHDHPFFMPNYRLASSLLHNHLSSSDLSFFSPCLCHPSFYTTIDATTAQAKPTGVQKIYHEEDIDFERR